MVLQEHSINRSQSQHILFTQQLAKNIALLSCNVAQLREVILKEIENNPALEIIEESDHESLEKIQHDTYMGYNTHNHSEFIERLLAYPETLNEYLLKQFVLEVDDPVDIKIGTLIIENLNEEGFLKDDVFNLCMVEGVTKEHIISVQKHIQGLDPIGCATKNSEESIRVQLSFLDIPQEVLGKIEECFSFIFSGQLEKEKNIKATKKEKQREKKVLESLNDVLLRDYLHSIHPYPGLLYTQYYAHNAKENYIIPDAMIEMDEKEIKIKINNDIIPVVGISERILENSKGKDEDTKKFSVQLLHSAQNFITGLQYRASAVEKVIFYIVQYQRMFLLSLQDSPKALTRKKIAQDLQMNESTVSRIISEKYIQTPKGIFPLRYFLSHGIGNSNISAQKVLKAIKEILKQHPGEKMTDTELMTLLSQKNIVLARRTVAKYRKRLETYRERYE